MVYNIHKQVMPESCHYLTEFLKLEFFKCMDIMLANLCHPYNILSTTVLSDNGGKGITLLFFVGCKGEHR